MTLSADEGEVAMSVSGRAICGSGTQVRFVSKTSTTLTARASKRRLFRGTHLLNLVDHPEIRLHTIWTGRRFALQVRDGRLGAFDLDETFRTDGLFAATRGVDVGRVVLWEVIGSGVEIQFRARV